MQFRPGRLAVSAVLCACLLAGCQPPAVTPSPAPTFRCTPEAGGAEFECSQQQHDEMVAKDELYAEAEAVYRRFFEEDVRMFRIGGADEATEVLLDTTAGDFLRDSLDLYRKLKREGRKSVGGEIRLASLVRAPGTSKGGSVVALRACIDASSTKTVVRGQVVEQGGSGSDLLYFGRFDAGLKIQGADGKAVESC